MGSTIYGAKRMRLLTLLAMLLLMAVCGAGCGPKTIEVLTQGLAEGKSIVIFPNVGNTTLWTQEGDSTTRYFADARPSGQKSYSVVVLPPGKYHVRSLFRRIPNDGSLLNGASAHSRYGQAVVRQTPRKRYEEQSVGMPHHDFYQSILVINQIPSYYEISYDFMRDSNFDAGYIGTLNVGGGEVLLTPGVYADASLQESGCRIVGRSGDFYFPGIYRTTFMGGINPDADFYTYELSCPVRNLVVDIVPASLADMRKSVDPEDFPPGALLRVQERAFTPGPFFEEEHRIERIGDGAERHIFSGLPEDSPRK